MATNRPLSRQKKSYQEPDKENNVIHKRPPSGGIRHLNNSNSSSLEILESEETSRKKEQYWDHRQPSSAKRGSHAGSVPPRPDSTLVRRTPTPTKQISLQAVRRKEEREDPLVADVDWKEIQSQRRNKGRKNDSLTEKFQELDVADKDLTPTEQSSISSSHSSRHHNCSHHHEEKTAETSDRSREIKETKKVVREGMSFESEQDGGSAAVGGRVASSDDSDSDDSEDEDKKAPNQLLMEFVSCLMEKDYLNAQKLCKMILLYEPDNAEALKFQPLIDEKIELDQEEEEAGSADSDDEGCDEDGEDGEGDSDDDSEDSDDDSDSDGDSSDSDSDSDDDDDGDEQQEDRLDSGIASAAGSVHFGM
ncbi:protein starmaker-like [Haliotis rufescens]|uniref:protein starmaker-like n=1 Tax=Haliotis rufescens TaxID=6454 RepID=UPI00201FAC5B|nr:protein starmaker-like [Haliotis rufescens]XP_046357474.2 protein starmaker-like [Haliotis rufescens]